MSRSKISGFTLAELIVVITILAILATIGFLALSGYTQDARDSALKANVRSVQTAISTESAVSGNSPRYYVVHDTGAALSGAFVYVDGNQVALTWGNFGEAPLDSNYSAGNPNYARLKLNPEKFKISKLGRAVAEALAAYDSKLLSVGAMEAQSVGVNGKQRTVSWFQVAGISPATKIATVSGNFPQPSVAESASWAVSGLVRDPSLGTTGAVKDGAIAGIANNEQSAGAAADISGNDTTWRTWSDGTYAASCNEYLNAPAGKTYGGTTGNGIYWIDPNGGSNADGYKVYCDMTTNGGGWTLVMKVDGTKSTFTYTAAYWTNTTTLNPETSLGMSKTEYKGMAYSTLPYTSILMQSDTSGTIRNVYLPWSGASLYAKISPDTAVTETLQSASVWNNFVPSGYLQTSSMVNGYNRKHGFIGVRIWAVADNTATLGDSDSMSWFGGWAGYHSPPAAGAHNWDQFPSGYTSGSKPTFGYLYVR